MHSIFLLLLGQNGHTYTILYNIPIIVEMFSSASFLLICSSCRYFSCQHSRTCRLPPPPAAGGHTSRTAGGLRWAGQALTQTVNGAGMADIKGGALWEQTPHVLRIPGRHYIKHEGTGQRASWSLRQGTLVRGLFYSFACVQ